MHLRVLLKHRHQWVRMRTRVQNTLQAIALSNGLRRGSTLWSQAGQHAIASLPLAPNAAHRRTQLQTLYRKLDRQIGKLDERVRDQALGRPGAKLLMTHPGVGAVTALATDVFLGDPARFADGKALASYVGMIPSEHSSGGRQRLGKLSKQKQKGNQKTLYTADVVRDGSGDHVTLLTRSENFGLYYTPQPDTTTIT